MKKIRLLPALTGAMLLCGCDRQTKVNMEKIELMSEKMVQLQQNQARQMEVFQTQLTSLAPMLDKMNNFYFEKGHDDALFFHTNTLYLLLTVDKNIESDLRVADAGRDAQNALAYDYHTNQLAMLHLYAAQIQDALDSQEKRIGDNVNAETRRVGAGLGDELTKQIKLSAPDATEAARLKEMAADLAQIKRDLNALKAQLGQMTNSPVAAP